jgi:hypothetical protein
MVLGVVFEVDEAVAVAVAFSAAAAAAAPVTIIGWSTRL